MSHSSATQVRYLGVVTHYNQPHLLTCTSSRPHCRHTFSSAPRPGTTAPRTSIRVPFLDQVCQGNREIFLNQPLADPPTRLSFYPAATASARLETPSWEVCTPGHLIVGALRSPVLDYHSPAWRIRYKLRPSASGWVPHQQKPKILPASLLSLQFSKVEGHCMYLFMVAQALSRAMRPRSM